MQKLVLLVIVVLQTAFANAQVLSGDSIPVRLQSFNVSHTDTGNKLRWQVTCSLPYAVFEIERSYDGNQFQVIHRFQADQLRCREPFDYTDQALGERVYYRLRVGDVDGKFYISKVVTLGGQAGQILHIDEIPAYFSNQYFTLSAISPVSQVIEIRITSIIGYLVFKKSYGLSIGYNTLQVNLPYMPGGVYIFSVINGKGEMKSTQIIKQ